MHLIKEDWSFALLESGVQCVKITGGGDNISNQLSVVNWGILYQVYFLSSFENRMTFNLFRCPSSNIWRFWNSSKSAKTRV